MTNPDLAALSAAATQGEWLVSQCNFDNYAYTISAPALNGQYSHVVADVCLRDHAKANAALITALVNEYRAGRLVQIDEGMRERLPGIIREAVMRRDSEPGDYADHAADAAITAMMGGAK